MARLRKLSASAVNIRTHDPSSSKYIHLIREMFRLRTPVKIRSDSYILISNIENNFAAEQDVIFVHWRALQELIQIHPGLMRKHWMRRMKPT